MINGSTTKRARFLGRIAGQRVHLFPVEVFRADGTVWTGQTLAWEGTVASATAGEAAAWAIDRHFEREPVATGVDVFVAGPKGGITHRFRTASGAVGHILLNGLHRVDQLALF